MRIVAIGASAGGLEPLKTLLSVLPPDFPAAVVIAQHLSPSHVSLLVELLVRASRLPVKEIQDGQPVEAGHIYVTPPNHDVELQDGTLRLSEPTAGPGPKPRVNRLFETLARTCGENAVGIVLSGTGSDGAAGLEAIRAAGGITIAQHPDSCQYDGMPRAAIELGAADRLLTPAQTGAFLAALPSSGPPQEAVVESDHLERLLDMASRESGVNLLRYRRKSLLRRVARRMALVHIKEVPAYLKWCEQHRDELLALVQDVFISVTHFFRDTAAFDALRPHLDKRLAGLAERTEFRVWIAGCASGEEAYSIAIHIEESLRSLRRNIGYRIFATDISERALTKARAGIYSGEALADLPPDWLESYFVPASDGYQINRRIRDRVVFSVNDLGQDAPFARMDLVCCRNVLIYFMPEHQRHILQTLHYALNPRGLLMLGNTESTSPAGDIFSPLDEGARLYIKEGISRPPKVFQARANLENTHARRRVAERESESVELRLLRELSRLHAPAAAVINSHNELVYSFGDCTPFLGMTPGPKSPDFTALIAEPMRAPLRAAVFRYRRQLREQTSQESRSLRLPLGENTEAEVTLSAFDPAREDWLLIGLRHTASKVAEHRLAALRTPDDASLVNLLESELSESRSSLQIVVQELETTNEELQAANEELQSANEEFQSTNEELQTTNEELRSTNEELLTVNDELNQKSADLARAHSDLDSVLMCMPTPLLLINEELRVRLYSPAVDQILNRVGIRMEDGLLALPWRVDIPNLRQSVQTVLKTGEPVRGQLEAEQRHWHYQFNLVEEKMSGARSVLLLFVDVSDLDQARQALQHKDWQMDRTLEAVSDALLRLSPSGQLLYANPPALSLFGADSALAIPLQGYHLHTGQGQTCLHDIALRVCQNMRVENIEAYWNYEAHTRQLSISALPLMGQGQADGVLLSLRDVGEQRQAEQRLVWMSQHDPLTQLLNRAGFEGRLRQAAQASAQTHYALLHLDLDQFKLVNDAAGHPAGDQLIQRIAQIICSHVRDSDAVGRLGGDEFGVILANLDLAGAEKRAHRIRESIEALRFVWLDRTFRVSASIGISRFQPDDPDGSRTFALADAACLHAKRRGKNRVETDTGSGLLLEQRRSDADWSQRVRKACEEGGMLARYEEIAPLQGGPSRWELLVRLTENGQIISPGKFIPAAERSGSIVALDRWALSTAMALLRGRSAHALPLRLHVNLSAVSIGDEQFLADILVNLKSQPAIARQIAFEVTETAAFSNLEAARRFFEAVRGQGCEVFLDDFGTGASSLGYLKQLPVDGLKIDGIFTRELPHSTTEVALVRAIHVLAQTLNLHTVAEYARTPEVVAFLRDLGVGWAQGEAFRMELERIPDA